MKTISDWRANPPDTEHNPRIYGKTLVDGKKVHIETSPIECVLSEQCDDSVVVRTRSGSHYRLAGPSTENNIEWAPETLYPFTKYQLEGLGFTFSDIPMCGYVDSLIAGSVIWHAHEEVVLADEDGNVLEVEWEAQATENRPCMVRFAKGYGKTPAEARLSAIEALEARILRDRGRRPIAAEVKNGECKVIYG